MKDYVGRFFRIHKSIGLIAPKKMVRALGWDVGTMVLFQIINKEELKLTKVRLPNELL